MNILKSLSPKAVFWLLVCVRTSIVLVPLENRYKSFILPHFDYADVIWDNCTTRLSKEFEHLHVDAIKTMTGTVRGRSRQSLYENSGFLTLPERRCRRKVILYHKIMNGDTLSYLEALLPALVSSVNPHHKRRRYERLIPPH